MTSIIYEYNKVIVTDPLSLGSLSQLEVSENYELILRHDSNQQIQDCGFYISPFSKKYTGTDSAVKDYERLLWYANNYAGCGLSILQEYEVTGVIDAHDDNRLADFERLERKDIFTGSKIEILSGLSLGETVVIKSYDPDRQIFVVDGSFSNNVLGENYRILISNETFFKNKSGSSISYPIPLIYKAGIIERLDSTKVVLKLKIPKNALSAGSFLFDLNLKFTGLEG